MEVFVMLQANNLCARRAVYLDGTDLERDCEALVRLRLTYAGPLLSSNPLDPDKRIEHKHAIRRHFHKQLKECWNTTRWLNELQIFPGDNILPERAQQVWGHDLNTPRPAAEVLGRSFGHSDYEYVPLAWESAHLTCSLRILCLRRDAPGAVLAGRDLDNRIKTVIDALCMPSFRQGKPTKDRLPLDPDPDEKPFFVLLEDDKLVSHLEIETDTALEPNPADPADESFVRLVISIEIRPSAVTMFNLSFA
jgi:hypothetical protein